MIIELNRVAAGQDSTLGIITLDKVFECFTLEDEAREIKVPGETRIPAGSYQVEFRKILSPMTKKYRKKYSWFTWHLELKNVPGFQFIYIHIGNYTYNSNGCILVGQGAQAKKGEFVISSSALAFRDIYDKCTKALLIEKITMEVI